MDNVAQLSESSVKYLSIAIKLQAEFHKFYKSVLNSFMAAFYLKKIINIKKK